MRKGMKSILHEGNEVALHTSSNSKSNYAFGKLTKLKQKTIQSEESAKYQ